MAALSQQHTYAIGKNGQIRAHRAPPAGICIAPITPADEITTIWDMASCSKGHGVHASSSGFV